MTKSTAAVLRAADGPFTVEEVTLDDPGPGEVLVKITAAGLCHTDLLTRHGLPLPMPVVVGHEGAGIVEQVGPGVTRLRPGDHVVLTFDSCGTCAHCLTGTPAYCDDFLPRNLTGVGAAGAGPGRPRMADRSGASVASRWFGQSSLAGHAIAAERNAVRVDEDLPLELLGPLGCGIQTGAGAVLEYLKPSSHSSVAVFGAGAVRLAAVMAAHAAGAREIIAVDLHESRRELALELGATHACDGADPDLAARIRSWTGGGADTALDTTGVSAVVGTALASLRNRGVCALVGAGGEIVLPPQILSAGKVLTFLMEGDAVPQVFVPRLISLWRQGRFPFDRLIRTYPLKAVNEAENDRVAGLTVKPVLLMEH
ncbi:NAD(P)-dependent alcohol dehydrogenase [Streptomyces sp. NPDC051985]|uniref:NAD(P)-dependent alcohol dehydrogenase n=1 Tax=Streptomyces sp. NPDC051985 TaxID=3155807 RepID=UPI00343479BD